MTPFDAVDLFAGAGGWDVAARNLGLHVLGLELDGAACRTRYAAGLTTWQTDVSTTVPCTFLGTRGLIASPPCQDFSSAGRRAGRDGERGRLIDEVPRWVYLMRPRWFVCEQVPEALPVWRQHAHDIYRPQGYSTWCGVLNAADFGVPQKRLRAFLMGSLEHPVRPPAPTHHDSSTPDLFDELEPWVTMAEALDYGPDPGPEFARRWPWVRPSTTVCGDPRVARPGHRDRAGGVAQFVDSIRVDLDGRARLQSFPPDYPFQGTQGQKDQQVGNAVPPLLAERILAELVTPEREADR